MKKQVVITCLLLTVIFPTSSGQLHAAHFSPSGGGSAQVYFSPAGGATGAMISQIGGARSEILVMAYAFRSQAIAQALIAAHQSGVKVEILMDKSERQEGFTPVTMATNAGIPVWLDGRHAAMNNRVIIIDHKIVITGSFNFNSASEEMNAENLLVVQSAELAKSYRENWLIHQKHSEKY